jgi:hypothetical protein
VSSKKVLIMPTRTPERPSRLRHNENPPYPEFAIEMLREVSKAISDEISPIREDIGAIKFAIASFQSELKSHGEKLGVLTEVAHDVKALQTESRKHGTKLEDVEGLVHKVKGILWFISVLGGGIILYASALQVYKYFHP